MTKETLFKTQISSGTYDEFLETIISLPKVKSSSYVCFANVHMITTCYNDEKFNRIVNGADVVAPDGKPIAVFLSIFKHLKQAKISGPDMFPDLLKAAAARNKTVFFYGATEPILQKIVARAVKEFPSLKISGYYAPPFRELLPHEDEAIISMINALKPDLMFVALGCPKQEKCMADHVGKINTCMLGVGQAFQIFAGEVKRAPVWMQSSGLEWAYRLWSEPGRLWKRYAYSNALFLLITIRYLLMLALHSMRFHALKHHNS